MDYYTISESQTIELKEASDRLPISLFETYSSFANTKGGKIYLGIKEKKPRNIITGVSNAPMLKKAFFDAIHNKTKVSVCLGGDEIWREIEFEGKTLIEITVIEAPIALKPVFLNGNPTFSYLRGADGDYIASSFERKAMELDAFPQKMDMRPNSYGYRLNDLNRETLTAYRAIFNSKNPDNLFISEPDEEFYAHIGVLKRGQSGEMLATNAAILLFGNYLMIKEIFPEYNLDYREQTSGNPRWDYRLESSSLTWSGNAFDFFRMVISHIRPILPNRFHLDGVFENGGESLLECVREGLTNAIANCDYLLPGGIKIVFDGKRIVFQNAGSPRLPLRQILIGGDSDPRNEGIMNLLHLAKIGDKAGTGVPTIYRRMKMLGYPEPLLEQSAAPFKTTLTLFVTERSASNDPVLEGRILQCLSEKREASVSEIASALSLSTASISLALKEMKKAGRVLDNGKKTKGKKFFLSDF